MLRKELQKDIKPLQGKRIGGASTRRQQARPPLRQPVPKVAKQPPKTVKLEQIGFFLHDKVEDRSCEWSYLYTIAPTKGPQTDICMSA